MLKAECGVMEQQDFHRWPQQQRLKKFFFQIVLAVTNVFSISTSKHALISNCSFVCTILKSEKSKFWQNKVEQFCINKNGPKSRTTSSTCWGWIHRPHCMQLYHSFFLKNKAYPLVSPCVAPLPLILGLSVFFFYFWVIAYLLFKVWW